MNRTAEWMLRRMAMSGTTPMPRSAATDSSHSSNQRGLGDHQLPGGPGERAAGIASAVMFVIAASTMLARLREHAQHLVGWGFGGVGAGIALSGAVVLAVRTTGTGRTAWLASTALALALTAVAWMLRTEAKNFPAVRQRSGGVAGFPHRVGMMVEPFRSAHRSET